MKALANDPTYLLLNSTVCVVLIGIVAFLWHCFTLWLDDSTYSSNNLILDDSDSHSANPERVMITAQICKDYLFREHHHLHDEITAYLCNDSQRRDMIVTRKNQRLLDKLMVREWPESVLNKQQSIRDWLESMSISSEKPSTFLIPFHERSPLFDEMMIPKEFIPNYLINEIKQEQWSQWQDLIGHNELTNVYFNDQNQNALFAGFHEWKPLTRYLHRSDDLQSYYNNVSSVKSLIPDLLFDNDDDRSLYYYWTVTYEELKMRWKKKTKNKSDWIGPLLDSILIDEIQNQKNTNNEPNDEWMKSMLLLLNDEMRSDPIAKLRFSNEGQQTSLHFDGTWNVFVQMAGIKSFVLFDPIIHNDHGSKCDPICEFPCTHPHSSHAQCLLYPRESHINGINDLFDRLILSSKDEWYNPMMIATLRPGDILVIPPLVWHHCISHSHSISLHQWTNGKTFELAQLLYQTGPLPFDNFDQTLLMVSQYWPYLNNADENVLVDSMRMNRIMMAMLVQSWKVFRFIEYVMSDDHNCFQSGQHAAQSMFLRVLRIRFSKQVILEMDFNSDSMKSFILRARQAWLGVLSEDEQVTNEGSHPLSSFSLSSSKIWWTIVNSSLLILTDLNAESSEKLRLFYSQMFESVKYESDRYSDTIKRSRFLISEMKECHSVSLFVSNWIEYMFHTILYVKD